MGGGRIIHMLCVHFPIFEVLVPCCMPAISLAFLFPDFSFLRLSLFVSGVGAISQSKQSLVHEDCTCKEKEGKWWAWRV